MRHRLLPDSGLASGIALLLTVVFLWTASNFITQGLFDDGYDKPFLVTYLNTSSFALYLIPFAYKQWRLGRTRANYTSIPPQPSSPTSSTFAAPLKTDEPLTIRETINLAGVFCLLWFIANWTVNASLQYTSVPSATILASMSGFFTMLIGRLVQVETLNVGRFAAVLLSFAGVVLVSLSDATPNLLSSPRRPILGDILALLSALFYALYTTLLKRRIGSESRIDMQLFFGFVGLFNVVGLWPLGILLHWWGAETFRLPHGRAEWGAVLLNMFITLSSDYLYLLSLLKTTPLLVTIGLSLTIPCAIAGEIIFLPSDAPTPFIRVLGAVLVIGGFVLVGLDEKASTRNEVVVEEDQ